MASSWTGANPCWRPTADTTISLVRLALTSLNEPKVVSVAAQGLMNFFSLKDWKGYCHDNPASVVAALWPIITLAFPVILLNTPLALLPATPNATAFRVRSFALGWWMFTWFVAPFLAVPMYKNRYRPTRYILSWLVAFCVLTMLGVMMVRKGHVISDGVVTYRAAEFWKHDRVVEPGQAIGLMKGCSVLRGRGVVYTPIYRLFFRDNGSFRTIDLGEDVTRSNAAAWTQAVSGLRLDHIAFSRDIGSDRFSLHSKNETPRQRSGDDDFLECLSAYRRHLDPRTFAHFSNLVGAPARVRALSSTTAPAVHPMQPISPSAS
jgi:hypothetical protein